MTADIREQLQRTLTGSYTLERELGGGGMSRVFVAEEQRLKRKVVVKVLSPELAAGVSAERFEREIQMAASLQQANIVPVLSAGDTNGLPYYTMPLVDGQSLRSRLASGPLSVTESIGILRDVARALAYAHEHGVVHRDIKPDNVLLSGGAAVVTDFGIAKALSAARTESGGPTLTQLGTSIGTPAYMAPEQAAGDPEIDYRADIYSLGCLAFELLAGRPPFANRTPQRMLAAHMGENPPHVGEFRPDTPAALAELVMKCLSKEASGRPQNALEIIRVLDSVTSGGGLPAMPPILLGGPGMLKKALALYAAAFVAVVILSRAAIVAIGLPDWVFPGSLVVMALGLPVILFTGYVHHVNRQLATLTPTFTPGGTPSMPQGTMATLAVKATPHVSWYRTAMGGVYAIGTFVLLIGGYMILRALGIGPAGSLFAAGKLSENERLLVAEFGVKGSADSSIGSVVAEAIRTDLGQSQAMAIVPLSAIRTALQRMQRPIDSKLDLALARDVAQREGIKAVVHGDITPLGDGFVVTARLVTAAAGDELASFRETAEAPKDLIPAVEKLSRALRAKMGESLRAVRATPRLDQVTTGSLEALRKYTEANAISDLDHPRAIGLLKESVAIDSTFAMAWRKLGVLYGNASYSRALQDSATVRAFRHRDRLTQSERDNVEGYYYGSVLEDHAKEVQVYERIVARGEFGAPAHNLALRLGSRGQYVSAESLYRAVIASEAGFVSYQNLAWVLYHQGRWRETDSVLAETDAKFNNPPLLLRARVAMAYEAGRFDSVATLLQRMREDRDLYVRAQGWQFTANFEAVRGRLSAERRALAQARAVDSARGALTRPLDENIRSALEDAWFRGQPERAARTLDSLLTRVSLRALPREQRPYFELAIAYAKSGRPDRARRMLDQYDSEVRDTAQRRIDEALRTYALAELAISERRYADAAELFRKMDQLVELSVNWCPPCLDVSLARTFDLEGRADSAVFYFERYLKTPWLFRLWGPDPVDLDHRAATHKRLGELYEARGEHAKAIPHYERFVELWKDADPELQPRVSEVRRRLARLRDTERR